MVQNDQYYIFLTISDHFGPICTFFLPFRTKINFWRQNRKCFGATNQVLFEMIQLYVKEASPFGKDRIQKLYIILLDKLLPFLKMAFDHYIIQGRIHN